MTPRVLLWLACGVGALLFVALGVMIAALRARRQGEASPSLSAVDREPLELRDRELAHAREQIAALEAKVAAASGRSEGHADAVAVLRAQLAEVKALAEQRRRDADELRARADAAAARAASLDERGRERQQEIADLRQRLEQRASALEAARNATEQAQVERNAAIRAQRKAETEHAAADARLALMESQLDEARRRSSDEREERVHELSQQLHAALAAQETQRQRLAVAEQQAEQLREGQAQARARIGELEAEAGQLRAGAARSEAALEQRLLDQQELLREQEARIRELDQLGPLRDEHERLKLELAAMRRRANDAEERREQNAELQLTLSELRGERDELAARLRELEAVEGERHELALRVGVLDERLRELEVLRESRRKLTETEAELEELRARNEQLRVEVSSLRAQGLARTPARLPEASISGAGLNRLVEQLLARGEAHCATLADELGLVVAAAGDHAEAMAAMSAFYTQLDQKTRDILPLGPLRRLVLADENGLQFTAQPIATESGPLMLATISSGDLSPQ
jgi:chromosome segregation ATPase